MPRLPKDAIVLCGAGVSRDSGLPDGQEMAAIAFEQVWAGTRMYPPDAADAVREALRWPASGEPKLRLELILDLMAREIPPVVLAGVYTAVLRAQPCLAHLALAAAAVPIVTINQDELVEDAARRLGVTVAG